MPRAWPMTATPAAEPIDNIEPPAPAVSVISSHWNKSISGDISSTANITGILSISAEAKPTRILAVVGPSPS